ncbi:MAG: hypothetical protein JXQ76_10875, partial [Campylobacterales bacterium]|nr:hypothetical protein [Campylobacterales bacterium]
MEEKKGSQIKNLFVSMVVFLILLLLINQGATQYVANHFSYHEALGKPIFGQFYSFWQWIPWSAKYASIDGDFFKMLFIYVALAIIALIIIFIVLRLFA